MKKHFLLTLMLTSFHSIFHAAELEALSKRLIHAIAAQTPGEALSLINTGSFDLPNNILQIARQVLEHKTIYLKLPLLSFAVFCRQLPVVETLLRRGHSPKELITCQEIRHEDHGINSHTITLFEMATTYNKQALPIINKYLIQEQSQQAGTRFPEDPQPVSRKRKAQAAGEDTIDDETTTDEE